MSSIFSRIRSRTWYFIICINVTIIFIWIKQHTEKSMQGETKHPIKNISTNWSYPYYAGNWSYPYYAGIRVPCIKGKEATISKTMRFIRDIKYEEGDIMICGYPRSGHHWLTEIIHMITHHTLDNIVSDEFPMALEFDIFVKRHFLSFLKLLKPRLLRSHLPSRLLPRQHLENKGKIVFIKRNPKDVAVSLYNYATEYKKTQPWLEYVTNFVNGSHDVYGGWFQYNREWDIFEKRYPDYQLHRVYYEELQAKPIETIKEIAEYLGVNINDTMIRHISDKCSFEMMKKWEKGLPERMYRKGKAGDWKNWFTDAQSKMFDKRLKQIMNDYNITIKYYNT